MKRYLAVAAVAAMLLTASVAQGTIILAKWTFETSKPTTAGPHAAEEGIFGGDATGYHTLSGAAYSNPAGNGSAESFSSNYWSTGDYYQFETSTLGYTDVQFTFDQTRSSTGPATFDLLVSTDGTNWTTLATDYAVGTASWSSNPAYYKPESVLGPFADASLDNQTKIYIRMVSKVTPTNTGGTNRIDNVTVTPEPVTITLLGLGSLLFLRRRHA
ncbi:MAG: hypothetical protein GXY55_12155 [Phycisphaerae bacterium]|nr:hypothetical protein [Phycisphaerae bacterium]